MAPRGQLVLICSKYATWGLLQALRMGLQGLLEYSSSVWGCWSCKHSNSWATCCQGGASRWVYVQRQQVAGACLQLDSCSLSVML